MNRYTDSSAETEIKTGFAGLSLKSPIIVGSCSHTAQIGKIVEFEKAGAGAVVLKSLFEESILREVAGTEGLDAHPEAYEYIAAYAEKDAVSSYLALIREARQKVSIPVIASIACHTDGKWAEFAAQVEKAGADAIEINVMALCTSKDYKAGSFEKMHEEVLKHVKSVVSIPVIVKIGSNLSNPVALADSLKAWGAAAVVLFNRFYPTDIDVERLTFTMSAPFTTTSDLSQSIRWAGIISAAVPGADLAVSGGVHDWTGVAKAILSGASAVEVASAVMQKGPEWISKANEGLRDWQLRKGYRSLDAYRGTMNASDEEKAERLMRTQFLKYFGSIH